MEEEAGGHWRSSEELVARGSWKKVLESSREKAKRASFQINAWSILLHLYDGTKQAGDVQLQGTLSARCLGNHEPSKHRASRHHQITIESNREKPRDLRTCMLHPGIQPIVKVSGTYRTDDRKDGDEFCGVPHRMYGPCTVQRHGLYLTFLKFYFYFYFFLFASNDIKSGQRKSNFKERQTSFFSVPNLPTIPSLFL